MSDDHPEELIEHGRDLMWFVSRRQLRRSDEIDEQNCDVAFVARQGFVGVDRAAHHLFTDVPAEQIAQLFAFPQSGDHSVESTLQSPDFRPFVHVEGPVDLAALDLGHGVDDFAQRIRYRDGHQDHRPKPEHHGDEGEHQQGQFDGRVLLR